MNQFILKFTALVLVTISLFSCKDKEEPTPEFNKGELLVNVSSNVIIPALGAFDTDVNAMVSAYNDFNSSPTTINLESLKSAWKDAYLTWQTVKIFDFGPIRNNGFKASTGVYPSDTTTINTNIQNGTYDLASAANVDAIGFSALDYLLYRPGALDSLQNNANCLTYVGNVIQKIQTETSVVIAQWSTYQATFNASTGTESTSAFSLFVNEYNRDFELAKNAKLGIPIGKQSLGIQLPEYLEARYSGMGMELLEANVIALRDVYLGKGYTSGSNGVGFDDYLAHLERANLSSAIQTKFTQIINQAASFQVTMEEAMSTQVADLDQLYVLMQEQVINMKTDMTSAFGVLITYADNDGD